MTPALLVAAAVALSPARAFAPATSPARTRCDLVARRMGLFDGVREAFGSDGSGDLSAERETPIDRWMGWNTKASDVGPAGAMAAGAIAGPAVEGFVDAMDAANYVSVALAKPMGIVFEENDADCGGIFILDLAKDGAAARDGTSRPGDQLVSVGREKVAGLPFEEALGRIVDAPADEDVTLQFFRGPAKFLYGPAGASQEWLDEFVRGEAAPTAQAVGVAATESASSS